MDEYDRHLEATQRILDDKFKNGLIKNIYIPEVLEGLNEIDDFEERVKALRNNSDRSLNTILQITFVEDRPILSGKMVAGLKYKAPYGGDDYSIAASNLFGVSKRLALFYRSDIPVDKMKKIATEILENLHPTEGEIFKGIFAGVLPYKRVDKALVKAAFPDLFSHEVEETAIAKSTDEEPAKDEDQKPEVEAPALDKAEQPDPVKPKSPTKAKAPKKEAK